MRIEHVAMYVNDIDAAKDFFVQYFGAEANNLYHNKKTDFKSYFLTFSDGARLEIMNRPQMCERNKENIYMGYAHIAFSVGSKEKVDTLTFSLKQAGYRIISEPRTTGDGYYESCILDMEGNQIEITI